MNQDRALQLLRQAASVLEGQNSTSTTRTSTVVTPTVSSAVRSIFGPYNQAHGTNSRTRRFTPSPARSYWSHKFCVLPRIVDTFKPTREEKDMLFKADLGEKKITFEKNDNPDYFRNQLEESYSKLRDIGGFEVLRSHSRSNCELQLIPMPPAGYTVNFLYNSSNLGQALCYIRPIQQDLSLAEPDLSDVGGLQQKCNKCLKMLPLRYLREHLKTCGDEEEESLPKKRNVVQIPVCQFACSSSSCPENEASQDKSGEGTCPVCQCQFPTEVLELHAASCGDKDQGEATPTDVLESKFHSLDKALEAKRQILNDCCNVSVVRRQFLKTEMEQLSDLEDKDWGKNISVVFIGEDALDAGGHQRELFSLLFSLLFEENTFYYNARFLQKNMYETVGRAIGYALIIGHPGPRNLHHHIVNYIIHEKCPKGNDINISDISDKAVKAAVNRIKDCTSDYTDCAIANANLLEKAGFTVVLNQDTQNEAINAIKEYFLFYRILGPLRQIMEGLKFVGVLEVLRRYPFSIQLLIIIG